MKASKQTKRNYSVQERAIHLLAVASVLSSCPGADALVSYHHGDFRWNFPAFSPPLKPGRTSSLSPAMSAALSSDDLVPSGTFSLIGLGESPSLGKQGLSKFHQSILSRSSERQRLVTGKDPIRITVEDNPTRRWLGIGREENAATAHLLVNGTTVERSAASFDRFQWIDDDERDELHERHAMVSLELIAEVHIKKPGYVNIMPSNGAGSTAALRRAVDASKGWVNRWNTDSALIDEIEGSKPPRDRLWVSGFSLTSQRGYLHSVDSESGHIASVDSRTYKSILWPNESNGVPMSLHEETDSKNSRDEFDDALLVSDGFLVPGKNKGGIYLVKNPSDPSSEWTTCLAGGEAKGSDAWFYHRAVWIDLTGDGRKSILTARAKTPSFLKNGKSAKGKNTPQVQQKGQLVWLEMPKAHSIDETTGTPLDEDGTAFDPFSARHTPWKEHVLAEGPDVMFAVADLDTKDQTIEVISSEFFDRKVSLYSIERGTTPRVTFSRTIDDKCGSAFAAILTDLDGQSPSHHRIAVDSGSTVETCKRGDGFSHVLVTSHECSYDSEIAGHAVSASEINVDGGSLFAYRVPEGKGAWKTDPWIRTTVASGFRVRGQLGNMINPGAPGFVYTFHPKKDGATAATRPLIAIAGDCAESAYILRPIGDEDSVAPGSLLDSSARYKLMCEIECGATVGSIAIGYDDFCATEQQSGYAKLYIPCYEKDKVLVFAMGNGEDDIDSDGW